MTYEQAAEKAKNTTSKEYELSIDRAESAKALIGKTLTNNKNGVSMKVEVWIGQNYVMFSKNDYFTVPVAYLLQFAKQLSIS